MQTKARRTSVWEWDFNPEKSNDTIFRLDGLYTGTPRTFLFVVSLIQLLVMTDVFASLFLAVLLSLKERVQRKRESVTSTAGCCS